jgi:ATPase
MQAIIWNSILDQYFDEHTMSLHLKAGRPILKKVWKPGAWNPVTDPNTIMSKDDLNTLIANLFKEAEDREDWFLEIDRTLSKVLQIW